MLTSTRARPLTIFGVGAVAMAVALVATVIVRAIIGQPTLAETVGGKLVLLIPGNLFEVGIQLFGPLAKKLLFVGLSIVQIVIGGGLALVIARFSQDSPRSAGHTLATFVRAAVVSLIVFGALTAIAVGFGALDSAAPTLLALAVGYGIVLAAASRVGDSPVVHQGQGHARTDWYPTSPSATRRGVVLASAGLAATATGLVVARATAAQASDPGRQLAAAPPLSPRAPSTAPAPAIATGSSSTITATSSGNLPAQLARQATTPMAAATPAPMVAGMLKFPPGESPEITPDNQFYKVSKNFFSDPQVNESTWRLQIGGLVGKPATLAMTDLTRMKSVEVPFTLTCVSNEVGGNLIGNAVWKGVPLADLLHEVGVGKDVSKVVFHAADGYADSVSLATALDPRTTLAYHMNGVPLPAGHGYPLRALVPNIYGMKNVKWLTAIELVKADFQGYWQRGGWSDSAVIKTMSRIDVAKGGAVGQPVTVAGIAFAGERGIAKVELSADGGKSWQPAQLDHSDTPDTWTRWVTQWTPTASGTVTLTVRAVDGTGQVQTAASAPPYPDGASGYHSVQVHIG